MYDRSALKLSEAQIANIALIQIEHLTQRLHAQNIQLDVSKEAIAFLAKAGFDPVYGARPLKRTIQQCLENPLAQSLLTGQFKSGETIQVSCDKQGALVFKT